MKNKYKKIIIQAMIVGAILLLQTSCSMKRNFEPEIIQYPDFEVIDFYPKTATIGQEITITGKGFGNFAAAAKVYFNGVKSHKITKFSDTEMVVLVPVDALSGTIEVNVWTHKKELNGKFNYIPGAKISSLSTTKSQPGETLIINGTKFGTDMDKVKVFFKGPLTPDGNPATIISLAEDKIELTIPVADVAGNIMIHVTTDEAGLQILEGPIFYLPINFEYLFDTNGNHQGWFDAAAATVVTTEVKDGALIIHHNMSNPLGYNRYDIRHANIYLDPVELPIIAVKWENASIGRTFRLHSSNGNFKNSAAPNNIDGFIAKEGGDVYYYDIRKGFGAGTPITDKPFLLAYLQWICTENTSTSRTSAKIHWMRNFKSIEALETYLNTQP